MFQAKLLKFDTPLSALEVSVACEGETWQTRSQIAKKLGCAKSPTLVKALHAAVQEGLLVWTLTKMPNGVDCYWYHTPNDVFETGGSKVTSAGQVIYIECP